MRLLKASIAALLSCVAASGPAYAVVLYDQTAVPAGGNVTSQNFEPSFDQFDSWTADDFVVPAQGWTVTGVFVDGQYIRGPASSVNVTFYADNGTVPGAIVADRPNQAMVDVNGDFTITLLSEVMLGPGNYWVSVQANQDVDPDGQWFWDTRTPQSGDPAAWKNPGGGFGIASCMDWRARQDCVSSPGPDQLFSLSGTVGISQIPEPATLALLGIALAGLGFSRRRRLAH